MPVEQTLLPPDELTEPEMDITTDLRSRDTMVMASTEPPPGSNPMAPSTEPPPDPTA